MTVSEATTLVLSAVRLGVLLLGLAVTRAAYTAYRRTGESFMGRATLGFAVITVGVFVEGVLYTLGGLDLTTVHIVESLTVGLGLLILYSSLR